MSSPIEELKQKIRQCFENNELSLTKRQFSQDVGKNFKNEIKNILATFKCEEEQLQSLLSSNKDLTVRRTLKLVPINEKTDVVIRLYQKNHPLMPQPPLIEVPNILEAKACDDNSVDLVWQLSNTARKSVTAYRLLFTSESGQNELLIQPGQLHIDSDSLRYKFKCVDSGVYEFKVQAVYDKFYGIVSAPSQQVVLVDKLKHFNAEYECLQAALREFKGYKEMIDSLDISAIQIEHENKECLFSELGLSCETKKALSEAWKFKISVNKRKLSHEISNVEENEKLIVRITYTYEVFCDNINDIRLSFPETIEHNFQANFVSSELKGFSVVVEISAEKSQKDLLNKLVESISQNNYQCDVNIDAQISVYGKIPEYIKTKRKKLTSLDIQSLQRFNNENFYNGLKEEPETLKICLKPCELKHYFSPIFVNLAGLKEKFLNERCDGITAIIDVIIEEVIQQITETANLIKSFKNHEQQTQCLSSLQKSFLLNANAMSDIFNEFETILNTEEKRLIESKMSLQNSAEFSAILDITCSLKTMVDELKKEIRKQLSSTFRIDFQKQTFIDMFTKFARQSYTLLEDEIKTCESKLNLMFEDEENKVMLGMSYKISRNYSDCPSSSVEVSFLKNGIPLPQKPPVFQVPINFKCSNISGNTATVSWSADDLLKDMATSYQVEYRLSEVKYDGQIKRDLKWQSISSSNSETEISVRNLVSGSYTFRLRAMFDGLPGMFTNLDHPVTISAVNIVEETESEISMFTNALGSKSELSRSWTETPEQLILEIRKHLKSLSFSYKKIEPFPEEECQLGDLFDVSRNEIVVTNSTFYQKYYLLKNDPVMFLYSDTSPEHSSKTMFWIKCVKQCEIASPKRACDITIDKYSSVHQVKIIYFGNWVKLTLNTSNKNRHMLESLFEEIQTKSREDAQKRDQTKFGIWHWSHWIPTIFSRMAKHQNKTWSCQHEPITYSITTNSFTTAQERKLNSDSANFLSKLDITSNMNPNKTIPVAIEIAPVDLEVYFSPLLDQLKRLKLSALQTDKKTQGLQQLVNFIENKVADEITSIAQKIKFEQNYQESTKFLKRLLTSFVFDIQSLEYLVKKFEELISEFESCCIYCQQNIDTEPGSKPYELRFEFGISICNFKQLEKLLDQIFKDKKCGDTLDILIYNLEKHFKETLNYISAEFDKILCLKDSNQDKNDNVFYKVTFSTKETNSFTTITFLKDGIPSNQKMLLLEKIHDIKASATTKNSIKLNWKSVDSSVRYYRIHYKNVAPGKAPEWKETSTTDNSVFKTIDKISSGQYVFQVQAMYDDINGILSEESEPISTRICFAEEIVKNLTPIDDGNCPTIYALPLKEEIVDSKMKLTMCRYGEESLNAYDKTIILLGATGSGKSTFINGLVNYLFNVDYSDDFRFKIINVKEGEQNKLQTKSQTEWITNYRICTSKSRGSRVQYNLNIVDTPGFGDTAGISRDFEIFKQIKIFFENTLQVLHAVCIVIPNSSLRLTQTQLYIFDTILSIFGNDIKRNIFVLVTFADTPRPPVIETLEEAKVPFSQFFPFNNSALFANNQGGDSFQFTEMFWNLGTKSFEAFVEKLSQTSSVSLQLTKEVLRERDHIELSILNFQKYLQEGLSTLEAIRKHKLEIGNSKTIIRDNEKFNYSVEESRLVKIDLPRGIHTTTCLVCNRTCHLNCAYADDRQKMLCIAMDSNGYCKSCSQNCFWDKHKNVPYKFEIQIVKVEKEYGEMKEKYHVTKTGLAGLEELLRKMHAEYHTQQAKVGAIIDRIRTMNQRLHKIALLPYSVNLTEYIDLLIETENLEKKPGYIERITEYKHIQYRTELLKEIEEKEDYFDKLLPKSTEV